jgi:hypothetical protein
MLSGVVSAYSNAITGAGQETIELGITASGKVASVVTPLAETGVAAAVGWANTAKLARDLGTVAYGYFVACKP